LGGIIAPCDDSTLDRPEGSQLDPAEACHRMLGGNLDRLVQIVAIENVEAGDPLSRLGVRAVRHEQLPRAYPDRRRIINWAQPVSSDVLAAAVHLGEPGADRLRC